ncbi:hypothetical protein BVX99_02620 [bacterium F16]|nr:hypothetical protein BVX99_02620 [bacterium F16]
MVNQSLREIVERALRETMENMAFFEVLHQDVEFDRNQDLVESHLSVTEPAIGSVTLFCQRSMAGMLVDELYGGTIEINDAVINDTLNELANTLAGQLIRLIRTDMVFSLGLPVCSVGPFSDLPEDALSFDVQNMPFAVYLDADFVRWADS